MRTTRAGLTRERILTESARVLNRRGYRGTTLDDIARSLGVTQAALYYPVRSKDELLLQCHLRSLEISMDAIREARARTSAPDEQLGIVVRRYLEGMTDELNATAVLLDEGALSSRVHRRLVERRDACEREVRRIIQDGIDRGIFVPCNPKLVGFAILGAMNWVPKWFAASGPVDGKTIAAAFAEYLVRGLLKRGPA